MEEDRLMTLHSQPDAFPWKCKWVKTYLAVTPWSGCLGGPDWLIACPSGHLPLVQQAWREAAASDQQMLQKIFYKLVFEASSASQTSLASCWGPLYWHLCISTEAAIPQKTGASVASYFNFLFSFFRLWVLSLSSSLRASNSATSSSWQPQIQNLVL